eukprot:TRINITY_DN17589_c0_g1_i2.p1 TRINITY_DN17589_c0_g1~~TRINITY_DN17589_c0_g1_i2.p1  ORF type:complete len:473 (-),score=114.28 TRINITY_DN17589_c0_g1_i2:62-1393(-)
MAAVALPAASPLPLSAAAVLKVRREGSEEVHRVRLESVTELSYATILRSLRQVVPDFRDGEARYLDEENDLCTLCPPSFEDFLACSGCDAAAAASGRPVVLRLELRPRQPLAAADAAKGPSVAPAAKRRPAAAAADAPWAFDAEALRHLLEERWRESRQQQVQGDAGGGAVPSVPSSASAAAPAECGARQDWFMQPKKLRWVFVTLREKGALSPDVGVSLFVHWLPMLLERLRGSPLSDDFDAGLERLLRSSSKDLLASVQGEAGSDFKAAAIVAFGNAIGSGEAIADKVVAKKALLAALTALQALPFGARVRAARQLYVALESHVHAFLDDRICNSEDKSSCPGPCPLEHRFVTCDGCGVSPVVGPRFKCRSCMDYDLCAACYLRHEDLHRPAVADRGHEFDCLLTDWLSKFKRQNPLEAMAMAVKGLGKGKGAAARGLRGA